MKLSKLPEFHENYKFYVLDVETKKLEPTPENFLFCVLYTENYYKVFYSIDEFKKELNKKYIKKNTFIYSHNAEFDLTSIFGNIKKNLDTKAVFNGKFICAKYKKVIFADSYNILPTSVKKLGELLNLYKLDNEEILNELKNGIISENAIKYCIRDCEIIYKSLNNIFKNTGKTFLTIASLSIYLFRSKFLKNNIYYNPELCEYFRKSYYGGRNEIFKFNNNEKLHVYDINSLYPFVMKNIYFPDFNKLTYEENISLEKFIYLINRYEGMAYLKLFHKENYFGFIPKKENQLLFPNGYFETHVNFNELRFALENNVIKIIKVNYVIYGKKVKSIFTEFIDYYYNIRKNEKNEFMKFYYKILLNSLYGKFGIKKKYSEEYVSDISKLNDFGNEIKLFNEKRLDAYVLKENSLSNSIYSIPLISSYITSEGRIFLLKSLLNNEKNVYYCDTDSIFINENEKFNGNIGNNLGEFKKENKIILKLLGLKHYIYLDENNNINELIKGVNKLSEKISDKEYLIKSYFKTKESIRRNLVAGKEKIYIKNISDKYSKRIILKNNDTKPIFLNETDKLF